ncbi:MAG TPA: hypothetical protein VEH06_18090 [Candidatus Bathyarchaeia archaeon]|nr:hypothetical protein [Candidatus Bathyarchaeia archaeon]
MKIATVVTAMTTLIISGILVDASTIPVTAQGPSSSSGFDPTPFLQSAKMHLIEAMKDIKMDNSQAALTQINMTGQALASAGVRLNVSIICNNINNVGYCQAPLLQFLK